MKGFVKIVGGEGGIGMELSCSEVRREDKLAMLYGLLKAFADDPFERGMLVTLLADEDFMNLFFSQSEASRDESAKVGLSLQDLTDRVLKEAKKNEG